MDDAYKLPTDPHEDRWNRLAVSSKKNDMKSVDVDERLDDYISFSRHNISAGLSFQNQAYKDLSKQEDKLKSFNQKILKEFEDLKRVRYFPNQQYRFPVSNEAVASSFIINPEQITPALKAAEERIKALEAEMDHREKDIVKTNGIVELLIEENKYLRDHISSKNRDINKILETVGLNDGETTHDLRHRLSLLSEENNILLAHLEELRAVKENFERYSREKNVELSRASDEYIECRRSLEEALKREELLTNYKQMMDPKFRHSQEKIAELEATISDLVEELSQVKNQNVLMSNQIGSYKRNMDDLDGKNALELDRLVQEVNILQNEKKEHKKVIEGKDKVLEERQNELKKVRRDFEQTKLEFEEIVQVMNDLKNQLANERQTTEAAVKREKDLRERNNKLAEELEKLQVKIRRHEDEHAQLIESLKIDYTTKISKQETKVQKLKNTLDDKEKKYKAEIAALKAQSEDLARILETVSAEREEYFKKWEGLSRESHLFGERERVIGELENEIDRLNKELDKSRRELVDTEQRYRSQNDDLRSESDKLNEINKQLREELLELKRYLEEEHPVREKDTHHHWRSARESTKAATVETQRRRDLGERDVNVQVRDYEGTKRSRSPSPTRKEGKSVSELEKENQYLHQMIKNLVQSENGAQSNYYANNATATDRTGSLSPLRTPDTRVYVGHLREGHIIEDHHRPVHVEHVVRTPVVEHVIHRPVERVVVREELRPITPVHHTTSVYPMRASMTASQYERGARESVGTYTDIKKKEAANVDTVISGILKKYNMEKIPDYVGKNKDLGQGDYSRRDNFESTREVHVSNIAPKADVGASVRSPQMQFLSPLLSSPKYESKSGSLENSVAKVDIKRDKILSPEAIDVIQTLKRDKV